MFLSVRKRYLFWELFFLLFLFIKWTMFIYLNFLKKSYQKVNIKFIEIFYWCRALNKTCGCGNIPVTDIILLYWMDVNLPS